MLDTFNQVLAVVKAIQALSALIGATETALSVPQMMASAGFLPFLFDTGGWTGDGPRHRIAGAVHDQELVFEAPIAGPNKTALLALRSAMQSGARLDVVMGRIAAAGFGMGSSVRGGVDSPELLSELRAIRASVNSIEVRPEVHIHADTDATKWLDLHMPTWQRKDSQKRSSS